MFWICNILLVCILLCTPTFGNPTTALFWHGETYQDTLFIERVASAIYKELVHSTTFIDPEFIRKHFSNEIFRATPTAYQLFFSAIPNGIRIDIHFKQYGSIQTAVVYTRTQTTLDSTRFLYPLIGANAADWFEFHLFTHLTNQGKNPNVFFGGNSKIKVDGSPLGAEVLLNGNPTGKKIPCVFDSLQAGDYLVEIFGEYCGAQKVQLLSNSTVGVKIQGKLTPSLLEVLSDPIGLEVEIDGVRSGFTPYYRESGSGELVVSVGGSGYEIISKRIELTPLEWKTLFFSPRLMHKVIVFSDPPGATIYHGPYRIGLAGDTLSCSPNGETWIVDHPRATPKEVFISGQENQVTVHHVKLNPAEAYLHLKNWQPASSLRYLNKTYKVSNPNEFPILAGQYTIEIITPGYKTKRIPIDLERGEFYTIDATPIPSPSWKSAVYSLAVPGLGQYQDGDWIRAGIYGALILTTAIGWYQSETQIISEIRSAKKAEEVYNRSLSVHSAQYWGSVMDQHWRQAEKFQTIRNYWATAFFVVWGSSVLDRILFPSRSVRLVPNPETNGIKLSWEIVP